MRRALGWILIVATLFAQSAWAFEGHVGHFEGDGPHQQAPAPDNGGDSTAPAASTHCAHSPVHFVAVHRDQLSLPDHAVGSEPPPYRAPVSSLHAEPPIQPPRG